MPFEYFKEMCIRAYMHVCSFTVLVERPEGKASLGRPTRKWKDNIKMDQDVGWGMDWIGDMW